MNTVLANTLSGDWRGDLEASRDVNPRQKAGFALVLGWYEKWRVARGLGPGRESARDFWKAQVQPKPREGWQLEQWAEGIRWFLGWLRYGEDQGGPVVTLEERVRGAVDRAGGRRGLAWNTRRTYASWAGRFARWVGDERAVMDPERAREWLSRLVTEERVSYATQKQALNGLAFFFRGVCGREEVDLQVTMRKTLPRVPVVMNAAEVVALLERLPKSCRLAAEMQVGSGLRVSELMRMRIKDVDVERRQVTVRGGKGDRDRVTVLPRAVADQLGAWKKRVRKLYEHYFRQVADYIHLNPVRAGLTSSGPKARVIDYQWSSLLL